MNTNIYRCFIYFLILSIIVVSRYSDALPNKPNINEEHNCSLMIGRLTSMSKPYLTGGFTQGKVAIYKSDRRGNKKSRLFHQGSFKDNQYTIQWRNWSKWHAVRPHFPYYRIFEKYKNDLGDTCSWKCGDAGIAGSSTRPIIFLIAQTINNADHYSKNKRTQMQAFRYWNYKLIDYLNKNRNLKDLHQGNLYENAERRRSQYCGLFFWQKDANYKTKPEYEKYYNNEIIHGIIFGIPIDDNIVHHEHTYFNKKYFKFSWMECVQDKCIRSVPRYYAQLFIKESTGNYHLQGAFYRGAKKDQMLDYYLPGGTHPCDYYRTSGRSMLYKKEGEREIPVADVYKFTDSEVNLIRNKMLMNEFVEKRLTT